MKTVYPVPMDPGRAKIVSDRVVRGLRGSFPDRQCLLQAGILANESVNRLTKGTTAGLERGPSANVSLTSHRLRLEVPLGTPFREIQEAIFRQACEQTGTQLRAAAALGVHPNTITRILKRAALRRKERTSFAKDESPFRPLRLGLEEGDDWPCDVETDDPMQN